MSRRARSLASCLAAAAVALAAAPAFAQPAPEGTPVKWDQARVTQMAVDLSQAIRDASEEIRRDPAQITPQQRVVWYELKEDLRMLKNSSGHLKAELQKGASMEETRATFERIESLRRQAEEHGRSSLTPAPVLDALTRAGAIHNQMRPYYYGKR